MCSESLFSWMSDRLMICSRQSQRAFTIIEMFAVLILISALVTMLLPAVQAAREMARRSSCGNNLMQVAISVSGYHNTFEQFPMQLSGTDGSVLPGRDNDKRVSFLVAVLPFVGESTVAERIASPLPRNQQNDMAMLEQSLGGDWERKPGATPKLWPAGGPSPTESTYVPWISEVPVFRCPSDPGYGGGRTNYAACLGDGLLAGDSGPMKEVKGIFVVDPELARQTAAAMRGVFVPRAVTRERDVTDGLSHTIALGEIATGLGDADKRTHPAAGPGPKTLRDNPNWGSGLVDADRPLFWLNAARGTVLDSTTECRRGRRWADGMPLYTSVNTILPPNREMVLHSDRDDCWGVVPPSSRHQGGVQVAMTDNSTRFISNSIDAGDPSQPTVYQGSANPPESESPYGVWGALGTRSGAEVSANTLAAAGDVE